MALDASTPESRLDRRKAKTRAALVASAQRFLAAGTPGVSIQDITDAADVGFGSFYNHFKTKDELFAEAVAVALDTWGELRDDIVAGLDDPAEIFGMSFRMTGRIQRAYPEMVRVLLHSGTSVLLNDRGLRPRAIADIAVGIEQGRFTMPDPEVAFMAAGGALLGLMQLLESQPGLDDEQVSDAFTERVLVMFGLNAEDAREIVSKPLPALPSIV